MVLSGVAVLVSCSSEDASKVSLPAEPEVQAQPAQAQPTMQKGDYRVLETFNVGDNVYVRSMEIDNKSNSLWIGTSVGVLEVNLADNQLAGTYTREQGLANEYVFGMHVDKKGNRWFGTNGGGISRFSANREWKTYFPMHGLADYWVYSFAEQSDGTLWIGTWAGLSRFDPDKGIFHTYLDELVNEWVYGLDVDAKDRVWIGTEGGINMFDGTNWKTWTHKDGLGATNEQNLPISDNTGLGTRSRHDLSVMADGQQTFNPNYVFDLIVAQDDTIWAGTWGGGVAHFDGSSWTNYTVKNGLAGNIVYSVAQDEMGGLWFGTNGGLSHFDGTSWTGYTRTEGLLDNNIYAIQPAPGGKIWVGARSGVMLLGK
ncbi:ligand-binding sensor domain-containing protein [Kaarinaea lacus]